MRKADLLALDMDGTLLHRDLALSDRNREALKAFREEGGIVFLCSGRPTGMTLPYVYEISSEVYSSNNGAYIGTKDGKEIFSMPIGKKTLHDIYDYVTEGGFRFSFLCAGGLYSNRGDFSVFATQNEIAMELARKHRLPEIWIRSFSKEDIDGLPDIYKAVIFKKGNEEDGGLLKYLYENEDISVTFSRSFMIDISRRGINKGSTLERCMDYLNIRKERVCAIGDYYNDVEMFERAGMSVAMGNSPEEVKRKATYTVSSCDEDGVAEAIEKYLL